MKKGRLPVTCPFQPGAVRGLPRISTSLDALIWTKGYKESNEISAQKSLVHIQQILRCKKIVNKCKFSLGKGISSGMMFGCWRFGFFAWMNRQATISSEKKN